MQDGELLIRWTVRLAMCCYGAVLIAAILSRRAPATTNASRWLWTLGCALFAGHVLSAFAFYHDWSHRHAFEDTAAKTEAAIGLAFGWGIYVNHLFLLAWIGDAAWSWAASDEYRRRPIWMVAALHAFLLFVAANGLMVFKSGPIRWTSVAAALGLAGLWIGTMSRQRNLLPRRSARANSNDSGRI